MKRLGLLFVLACGTDAGPGSKGPAYSPVVANQLSVLAPDCETQPGTGNAKEIRTCTGNSARLTVSLDGKRHLVALALEMRAWTPNQARNRLDHVLAGVTTPAALAAIKDGLGERRHAGAHDGITFQTTKTADQPAHYTLALSW
ncbi:MAG: hypothetical protein WKG01_11905 [Kofleriaceae bacterium]